MTKILEKRLIFILIITLIATIIPINILANDVTSENYQNDIYDEEGNIIGIEK